MKPEILQGYLQYPETLEHADGSGLRELARQFPYFTSLHFFILKNDKLRSAPLSEEEITAVAFRAPDRGRLKAFIFDENLRAIPEADTAINASGGDSENLAELLAESEMEISPQLSEETQADEEDIGGDHELESTQLLEGRIESRIADDRTDEFFMLNRNAGGGGEFVPVELPEDSEDDLVEEKEDAESIAIIEIENEMVSRTTEKRGEQFTRQVKEHAGQMQNEALTVDPNEQRSFLDWLDLFKHHKRLVPGDPNNTPVIALQEPVKKPDAGPHKIFQPSDELKVIDSFVRNTNEPATRESVSDIAERSVSDENLPASETLAEILAEQGKVEKAISVYEKLSLLHPEKSSYFAARIQKLKP